MSFENFIYSITVGDLQTFKAYSIPEFVNRKHTADKGWRPIHYSCGYGQIKMVKHLIKCHCKINALTNNKSHALHIAAQYGFAEIVQFLLKNQCNIELQNMSLDRPIHLASGYGHNSVVQILLQNNCSINAESMYGWTSLHWAARYNHATTIKLLLMHGANTNAKSTDGLTWSDFTHYYNKPCRELSVECLEVPKPKPHNWMFIAKDLPMAKEIIRSNPLDEILAAIKERNLCTFRTSYEEKYLSYKDSSGSSLLDIICEEGQKDMIELVLCEIIADEVLMSTRLYKEHTDVLLRHYHVYRALRTRDSEKWNLYSNVKTINQICIFTKESFIEIAAKYSGIELMTKVLQMILEMKNSFFKAKEMALTFASDEVRNAIEKREKYIHSRTLINWNRLHIAVYDDREDVVQYILERGLVEVSSTDSNLNTPLHLAIMLGHKECAKSLLKYEKDASRINKFGQTILHLAIDGSMEELITDILDLPVNITVQDSLNLTPLAAAILRGKEDVCLNIINKRKIIIYDMLLFEKTALRIFEKIRTDATLVLTDRESYFSFCLKTNGEIFPSLMDYLNLRVFNMTDGNGKTLLHLYIELFRLSQISSIINYGKSMVINKRDKNGNTSFHLFVKRFSTIDTHTEKIEELIGLFIEMGAEVFVQNNLGETLMSVCFLLNKENIFQMIFCHQGSVKFSPGEFDIIIDKEWFTALDIILTKMDPSLLSTSLTESNITKIMKNCSQDNVELILSSATTGLIDEKREELLIVAVERDFRDIFHRLIQKDITLKKKLPDGETLMTSILKKEKYYYCKALIKFERDETAIHDGDNLIDQKNGADQTALHIAVNCLDVELFESMLLESVHWNYLDASGNSAFTLLLTNVGQMMDENKIKEWEKIIKIMIRGGQDLFYLRRDGTACIDGCGNEDLRSRLVTFQKAVRPDKGNVGSLGLDAEKNICQICLYKEINCVLQCGHPFCKECALQLKSCPSCRKPIQKQLNLYL